MTAMLKRYRSRSAGKRVFSLVLLILLIISVPAVWFSRSNLFKVSRVNIFWDESKFTTPEIEEKIKNLLNNQLIFFVSQKKVLSGVGEFPVIQGIRISKSYPSTLTINLVTHKPALALISLAPGQDAASSSAQPYLVDSEGRVFWKDTADLSKNLPKLLFFDVPIPLIGQSVDSPDGRAALKFFSHYRELESTDGFPVIESLSASSSGPLTAKLSNGILVFLPAVDSYGALADSLHLILNKYKIEGKHLKKVDLRFKNPVVEY